MYFDYFNFFPSHFLTVAISWIQSELINIGRQSPSTFLSLILGCVKNNVSHPLVPMIADSFLLHTVKDNSYLK